MRKSKGPERRLWVIKAGSQMVIQGGSGLIRKWMKQVAELTLQHHIDVIWVTSGAIATAKVSRAKNRSYDISEKQALSAIGQPMVIDKYVRALEKIGHSGAQILLTADDLKNPKRRRNLVRTLSKLISWQVLPVLNENDAVATEEIQFGDNDRLSALVAKHMKAERLILLTDVEGLYDRDPGQRSSLRHSPPELIRHLKTITPKLVSSLTPRSGSGIGTGGMLSKILAAKEARRAGMTTHLVRGDKKEALLIIAHALKTQRRVFPGTTIHATRKK